jgi:hypothetical protein
VRLSTFATSSPLTKAENILNVIRRVSIYFLLDLCKLLQNAAKKILFFVSLCFGLKASGNSLQTVAIAARRVPEGCQTTSVVVIVPMHACS